MKITCQSCQSKYTIADDKVAGKIVKIRCKKCSAAIYVNGNDGTTTATPPADEEPLSRYPEAPAEGWTVNVAEGDQRTMSDGEVVEAFKSGVINDETFCWKDGMADWVPLKETGALFEQCAASMGGHAAAGGALGELATAFGANGSAAATSAARRHGGRATGIDLFSGAAQAGGEDEVLTSAPARGLPTAHEDHSKPTGARNENSVLFSLDALKTNSPSQPPPRLGGEEASGLIDIRQLSAQLGVQETKQSRVDDIMNLSGGAFTPNLAAPPMAAPSMDAYAPDSVAGGELGQSGGRGKGTILLAVGAAALIVVGVVGGAVMLMKKGPEGTGPTGPTAQAASDTPSAVAPPPPATASGPSEPAAAPTGEPSAKIAEKGAADSKPADKPAVKDTSAPAKVAAVAAAPAVEAGPFNMGEAKARLGAAAAAAAGCKKPNGPTGTGRVVVLFSPSGGAQSATISGPPFEGTPTGACVAGRFRAVRVPAFSGSPFSVSKSFTIN